MTELIGRDGIRDRTSMGPRRPALAAFLAVLLLSGFVTPEVQPARAAQATHLALDAPSEIHSGDEWQATVVLTDSTGNPLGGLTVNWYLDGQFVQSGVTSSDGSTFLGVGGWLTPLGDNTVSVSFNGTGAYLPSNATAIIDVLPENPTTYTTTTATTTVAGPVVELSPADGSTVCPNYFRGNESGGTWDQSAQTCTLAGGGNVYPAFCVSASPGGCTVSPIGRLVIDKNVTAVLSNGGSMAIYSEVDNYGTLVADITNYGIIQNHGTIDLNGTNQLLNLPYNGLGLVNNTEGATINNSYYITNPGIMYNYGAINNYGQFISQLCSPCVVGTLVNDGSYTGSAPAPVFSSTVALAGGNGTADQNSTAGVTVAITGATGSKVTVSTQVQGSQAPPGLGSVQLSSTSYYDILIDGTKTGTAHVCINSMALNATEGEIEYWNGTSWVGAANQTVSGGPPAFTFCGDIPVSALAGTPLAVGAASNTPVSTNTRTSGTTTSITGTSTAASTSQPAESTATSTPSGPSSPPRSPSSFWLGVVFFSFVVLLAVGIMAVMLRRRR